MSDRMPKVDPTKLRPSDLSHIKEIERLNLERVRKLQIIRQRNLITAGVLGTLVIGIYGYSIYAVKQEDFLDDLNEPTKTTQ